MASKVLSAAVVGLNGALVEVEAEIVPGSLGTFVIVGLPDAAVQESRERVRSAIINSGRNFPNKKLAVNLAPADLKKQGPSYDLPIAVSSLLASGRLNFTPTGKELFIGELALDGLLRSVSGVLPIAISAKKFGIEKLYVPEANAKEAAIVDGIEVLPVHSLSQLIGHLEGCEGLKPLRASSFIFDNIKTSFDMSQVSGQEQAKRALEIAAAGSHNMLMSGPPGSGKTMLAKTMPSILPKLSLEEALEITKIYSVAEKLPQNAALITERPFRSPHHTASSAALVGGGTWPRPGEISLAHRGVLFLDEFGEFARSMLENLRQPLEDGVINISRAAGSLSFPARFILIAAMNPCPCGYITDSQKNCTCTTQQVIAYQKKISGPILDRIDLHIEVPRLNFDKLNEDGQKETSADIRLRIENARDLQKQRLAAYGLLANSEMTSSLVKQFCRLNEDSVDIIRGAVEKLHLSARSYYRVLKVSRTIADLAGSECIETNHLAEALQYRQKISQR